MLLDINVKLRRGHFDLSTQISLENASAGLFGQSGAGKSTLLGLIAGTLQPQSGYIVLDGKILFDSRKGILVPREQRPIGAVLQTDSMPLAATVSEILHSIYRRCATRRRLFKPDYLIRLLELGPVLDQNIARLSAADRQRVMLARSLLKSPKMLLLDDTFAAIGNSYRMQLLPILKRLQAEFDLPALYASQSLREILQLTDKLIVLENGQILRSGPLREIARQQGILRYLGVRQIDNILPVHIRNHDYAAGYSLADSCGQPFNLPLRPQFTLGSQTQVSIRANDIALSHGFIEGISIQNQIKGRICALIPASDSVIVQVDCGCTLLVEITPGACTEMALREGTWIYCLIKTHAIVYLAELDSLPYEKVVNHDGGYYYLPAADANNHHFPV
ncbi:MAG: ATP-binding cassette domain-containing protein [Methylomonas sp.]|jgi:molybdate transport system ATP-binding protein|uniref:molybdenum ABC transporter ATP-binding protein n=1 Tax=Methylomonas sp. TaxID=418 RepID=UPI0025E8A8ED|nr:ATP-binding cassette domain-containing protein [Methylomonas sp.]MCK9606829.1 ATP-binding cassette domain-containing protein [Methylomonas sp.]